MKPLRVFRDLFGDLVEFSHARWKHVCETHPELADHIEELAETLGDPDLVKLSKSDPEVRLYYKFFPRVMKGKFIVAVVRRSKSSFFVTAYITDYVKAGEELWRRG